MTRTRGPALSRIGLLAAFLLMTAVGAQAQSNDIIFSTAPGVKNMYLTPEGEVTFYPEVHNSTSVTLAEFSTTATTYASCVTGSTVTLYTAGGRLELSFTGTLSNIGGGSWQFYAGVNFLLDGAYPTGLSAIDGFRSRIASYKSPLSINYLVDPVPPGRHDLCLSLSTADPNGGTAILYDSDAAQATNTFFVKELR